MLLLQLLSFVLAFGLPFLMAVFFDAGDRSMTWFTNKWLVFGLYICPCLFGLVAPTLFYLNWRRKVSLLYVHIKWIVIQLCF